MSRRRSGAQEIEDFVRALEDATAALEELASVGGGGGGGPSAALRGGEERDVGVRRRGRGRGRGGDRGAIGAGVTRGMRAVDPAVGAFVATGDVDVAFGSAGLRAINALAQIPITGEITGAASAARVLGRTQARVGGVTQDLAKYGVEVTEEFRQQQADVVIQQERRIEEERARVAGVVGQAGNIEAAAPEGSVVGLLTEIRANVRDVGGELLQMLRGLTGGAQ